MTFAQSLFYWLDWILVNFGCDLRFAIAINRSKHCEQLLSPDSEPDRLLHEDIND